MAFPDLAVRSARLEDRSSYQPVGPWTGLDGGLAKVTESDDWFDPTFLANWHNLAAAKLPRGAYHFFHPSIDAVAQAQWFMSKVKAAGLEDGDMLIADVEITVGADGGLVLGEHAGRRSHLLGAGPRARAIPRPGVPGRHHVALNATVSVSAGAAAFMTEVTRLAGPHHPLMVYTDLSVGALLGGLTGYDLWIAYYSATAPASVHPWPNWRIWQWAQGGGPGGGDPDSYNGTPAQLHAWIGSYLPKPAPPVVTSPMEEDTMLNAGKSAVTPILPPAGAKGITLGSDNSLTNEPAPKLRVAIHSAAQGWHISTFTLPKSGTHTEPFPHPDTDLISVQRVGGNAGDDVPVGFLIA